MQIRTFIISLIAVCVLVGCGGPQRPAGFPALFLCEITITQGGQPLVGADVRLMPESGSADWIISGKTGSNGVARVSTHGKFDGAPEGTFKVLVSKTLVKASQYTEPEDTASPEWGQWNARAAAEFRPLIMYVKPEYDDVNAAPHSITITRGRNKATFDVGEAVEIVVQ